MKRALAILALLLAPLVALAQDQPTPEQAPPEARTQPQPTPPPAAQPAPAEPAEPAPWISYPAREVDRPILPAARGYQMNIEGSSFYAGEQFDANGGLEKPVKPISVLNLDINVHYGIVDRWEVYVGLPYVTAKTSQFSTGATGNAYAGTRVALYATDRFQLAAGLQVSAPTGDSQFHYQVVNGKVVVENFRTGDPGVDFFPEVQAWFKSGSNLSVRLRALAIITGSGETVLNQIGGKDSKKNVNPGDGGAMSVALYYQVRDKWVVPVKLEYYQQTATEISGLKFDDLHESLILRAGVVYQYSTEFEMGVFAGYPLLGRNVYFAPPLGLEVRTRF